MFIHRRKKICSTRQSCAILWVFLSALALSALLNFGSDLSVSRTLQRLFIKAPQPGAHDSGGLLPQLRFTHLQPLVNMFANLTHVKPSRSDCMFSTTEFSDLKELETKQTIFLLIIVSTAPSRQERRDAIRQTWWTNCHGEVRCKFFTDGIQIPKQDKVNLANEKNIYKDIEFQPVVGGRTFGLRYLYQMMWAAVKYKFTYFLRLDDDYFLCLERLKFELRHRPTKILSWGRYHCGTGLIYMDEAWTLFTHDVIVRFLSQDPQRILCHPHADQQLPIWINSVFNKSDNLIHFDDQRLHLSKGPEKVKMFEKLTNACDSFMGIHGSSPELMQRFWKYSNDNAKEVTALTGILQTCKKPFAFDVSRMGKAFRFDPRPCIQNPQWRPGEIMWTGINSGAKKGSLPCP
ncbi:uncharacterized protein [Montipora foliosa]|uniref:uncharacterized protein n=1 Tax=Montipora foliosa TaxID=591990 RepID=UPI0035F1E36F